MKLRHLVAVSALAVLGGALPVATANAQETPHIEVQPRTVHSNDDVSVLGYCPAPGKPLAYSDGFAAPIPLGGKGKATLKFGVYPVTLKCGGETLTAEFTVQSRPAYLNVLPNRVEPGAAIEVTAFCQNGYEPLATSNGFAAPIKITFGGHSGVGYGKGKAATKPGKYTATFTCKDYKASTTFTILGNPGTTPPPSANPRQPPAEPQVVKPKGAPETGGGFLASPNR